MSPLSRLDARKDSTTRHRLPGSVPEQHEESVKTTHLWLRIRVAYNWHTFACVPTCSWHCVLSFSTDDYPLHWKPSTAFRPRALATRC